MVRLRTDLLRCKIGSFSSSLQKSALYTKMRACLLKNETSDPKEILSVGHWRTQLCSTFLQFNSCDPAAVPLLSLKLQVLVRMIIRSVRMLGRRTLGVTTPQASLSLLFTDNVYFLEWWAGVWGGKGQGAPKLALTLLWWFGAISKGKLATTKSW